MRFHLLMFIIVVIVSMGMRGMATAAPLPWGDGATTQPVPAAAG